MSATTPIRASPTSSDAPSSDAASSDATPATTGGRRTERGVAALHAIWPPLLVGVLAMLGWELVVTVFNIQKFLVPKPSAIGSAFGESFPQIVVGVGKTGWVAISGLLIGVVLAVLLALVCTRFAVLATVLTPLAAALAATPIVALAPVFFKWFGQVEPTAKQAVVVAVVLFPVFVSTSKGLLQVQPVHLELMRTYGVGGWRVLREVRVPNALPYFLTSLKVAVSLSVIAAIVAEYFGGEQGTLGGIITQSAGLSRYDRAWAAVLAAALLGMTLYAVVLLLERLLLRGQPPTRAHP
ncbi:ABC transporter permease [Lapillicoccus sp.]|uniref:ABC transporter permease n=1 Tax=Lapillicoccus sp. TaxID=1909287 RepID=UPI0039832B33